MWHNTYCGITICYAKWDEYARSVTHTAKFIRPSIFCPGRVLIATINSEKTSIITDEIENTLLTQGLNASRVTARTCTLCLRPTDY